MTTAAFCTSYSARDFQSCSFFRASSVQEGMIYEYIIFGEAPTVYKLCVCVCVCKRVPAHTLTTQLISTIGKPKLVYFGQNNPKVPVEEGER